jgi:hypothetical protein
MKKLFTLALVLLVATAGYSQVRMSKNDVMKKSAIQYVTRGMESFENVQSEPNMTRSDGELDYTTYDWQSNAGPRTWTIQWPDNKINFAYTMATDDAFSDRGTGIGTYDYNTDEWTPLWGRIESERTGFGSIARYKENGIVIAAHTSTECCVYILEDRNGLADAQGTLPRALTLSADNDPAWPAVMTSGANRDIIHVLATGSGDNNVYYYRSSDGMTWDKENVVLPYFTSEYGSDWGSNIAYWMETTEDNCLAYVVNNAWSDCMVCYSYDDGETWERKVFWHHPGINVTYDDSKLAFCYPRWTSCHWGLNGELCMAYEFNGSTGEPGSGSYYPGVGGVAFWSETLPYHGESQPLYGVDPTNPMPPMPGQPFIMDSAYLNSDILSSLWIYSETTHEMWPEYFGYVTPLDGQGNPEDPYTATEFNIEDFQLHGKYNCGISAMPALCLLPGCDGWDMVAVWSAMDENNQDGHGNHYFKLFASYSGDAGHTWSPQVQLTKGFDFQQSECVYTQAAVVGTTLVVASQQDFETGTFVQSDDDDSSDNCYFGLTFELNDLFPEAGVGVAEVSHNTHMTVYPNPAVDQLNVTLSQNADIEIYNVMGQKVMTFEGHAGANTISLNGLTSGVYVISAGSDVQKFIVK